eukprot:IDg14473t1
MASAAEEPMPPRTRGTEVEPPIPKEFAASSHYTPAHTVSRSAPPPFHEDETKRDSYARFRLHLAEVETGCLSEAKALRSHQYSSYIDSNMRYYYDARHDKSGWGYYNLGWCYEFGIGVGRPDKDKAFYYYYEAASLRHPAGLYALGLCYYEDEQYKYAADMFERSAKYGCSWGEVGLASCYFTGHGVSKSISKAYDNHRRAAEKGNKVAQYWLATCKDDYSISNSEARRLLELSCRNGYEAACDSKGDRAESKSSLPSHIQHGLILRHIVDFIDAILIRMQFHVVTLLCVTNGQIRARSFVKNAANQQVRLGELDAK